MAVNRSLAGWFVGFGSSVLADQVFFLSLTWAALQIGSPGEVGLVLAVGSIPRLVILLVGGALADAASPKRVVIVTDASRTLVMAVAAAVLMLGAMNTWGLVLVALAIGALDGLFLPAVGALPARIAPTHLMGRVAAMRTVTQRAGLMLGGPLAGWLIYLSGPAAAFWGSAGLFAISVSALAFVTLAARTAPPAKEVSTGPVRKLADGFVVVRRHPVLPWLLLLVAGMNLGFSGPVTAGLPLLADAESWGAGGAGLLLGAFGLGAMATGLGLVFVRRIAHAGLVSLLSVTVMGAALAAVGFLPSFPAALVATVVLGLASGAFGTVVHAMVLTCSPEAELGRVSALLALSVEGVVPISFAATGLLAGLLGVEATFAIGGAVILLSTAVAASRSSLRSFQLARAEPDGSSQPITSAERRLGDPDPET